jgi:ABC-type transporter Mla subunit MlaD
LRFVNHYWRTFDGVELRRERAKTMTLDDTIEDFLGAAERLVSACDEIRGAADSANESYDAFTAQIEAVDPKLDGLRRALDQFKSTGHWDVTLIDLIAQASTELSSELDELIDHAERLAESLDTIELIDSPEIADAA